MYDLAVSMCMQLHVCFVGVAGLCDRHCCCPVSHAWGFTRIEFTNLLGASIFKSLDTFFWRLHLPLHLLHMCKWDLLLQVL